MARHETTVAETASEDGTSSGEEFEIRIAPRAGAVAASASDETHSASDDETASVDETDEPERAANTCAFCSSRKVKACANLACKRCCVRQEQACSVHSKTPEPKIKKAADGAAVELVLQPLRKARKAVLKNEFKESSVQYYGETVTLFCLRDFFQAKKLSQPLLNDQTRRLRANNMAGPQTNETPKEKVRKEGSLKAKASVVDALRSGEFKRRKVE